MYAFGLGQRRPGAPGRGTAGTGARGCNSSARGIAPPIPVARRLAGVSGCVDVCLPERKYRLSWIYPTKLLLIQNRILSRHELPVLGCTRRLGEAETASR